MSQTFSSPISLLHKRIKINFDGNQDIAFVTSVNEEDECIEVLVNPDEEERQFFAELYLDNNPTDWYIAEILD